MEPESSIQSYGGWPMDSQIHSFISDRRGGFFHGRWCAQSIARSIITHRYPILSVFGDPLPWCTLDRRYTSLHITEFLAVVLCLLWCM